MQFVYFRGTSPTNADTNHEVTRNRNESDHYR